GVVVLVPVIDQAVAVRGALIDAQPEVIGAWPHVGVVVQVPVVPRFVRRGSAPVWGSRSVGGVVVVSRVESRRRRAWRRHHDIVRSPDGIHRVVAKVSLRVHHLKLDLQEITGAMSEGRLRARGKKRPPVDVYPNDGYGVRRGVVDLQLQAPVSRVDVRREPRREGSVADDRRSCGARVAYHPQSHRPGGEFCCVELHEQVGERPWDVCRVSWKLVEVKYSAYGEW